MTFLLLHKCLALSALSVMLGLCLAILMLSGYLQLMKYCKHNVWWECLKFTKQTCVAILILRLLHHFLDLLHQKRFSRKGQMFIFLTGKRQKLIHIYMTFLRFICNVDFKGFIQQNKCNDLNLGKFHTNSLNLCWAQLISDYSLSLHNKKEEGYLNSIHVRNNGGQWWCML